MKNINDLMNKKLNRYNAFKNEKELSIINSEENEPNFNYNKISDNIKQYNLDIDKDKEKEIFHINNKDQLEIITDSRKIFDISDNFSYKQILAKEKNSNDVSEKIKENKNDLIYEINKIGNFSNFEIGSNLNFVEKNKKFSKIISHNRYHSDNDINKLENNNNKNYFNYNLNKTKINQKPALSNFDLNVDKIYGFLEDFQKNIEKDFSEIEDQIENLLEKDFKLLK